jgi:hypothetical protein
MNAAGIGVISRDRPQLVDADSLGTLTVACAGARSIKRGDSAVRSAQKAVIHVAGIDVISRDRSRRVNVKGYGALVAACTRARSIKLGDGALLTAQETAKRVACVNVESTDRPRRVEGVGVGAVDRAGDMKRCDGAVMAAPEAVRYRADAENPPR